MIASITAPANANAKLTSVRLIFRVTRDAHLADSLLIVSRSEVNLLRQFDQGNIATILYNVIVLWVKNTASNWILVASRQTATDVHIANVHVRWLGLAVDTVTCRENGVVIENGS